MAKTQAQREAEALEQQMRDQEVAQAEAASAQSTDVPPGVEPDDDDRPVNAATAAYDAHMDAQRAIDAGLIDRNAFPGRPQASIDDEEAAKRAEAGQAGQGLTPEQWRPQLGGGDMPPQVILTSEDYRQQLVAKAQQEGQALHKQLSTALVPGGAYIVGGVMVDAEGEPLPLSTLREATDEHERRTLTQRQRIY